jgi:hypothetical protein
MRIAYTAAQKAEAVALATVIGAEGAATELGMDVRTVRGWAGRAGKAPELAAPTGGWQNLLDLAMAKVASALAGNKVRPKDAAVIAGIASRNVRERPPEAPQTEDDIARDAWTAELDRRYPDRNLACLALMALIRRHDEHGCPMPENDREPEPCREPLDDEWAYLESLGDLREWHERVMTDDHAAMERQLEANRKAARAYQTKVLDAEMVALVEAAEAFLTEQREETPDAV